MELGKVIGNVVSTVKDPSLSGTKLLIVSMIDPTGKDLKNHVVAIDNVGAGVGEVVILVRGSSARQAENMSSVPTDTTIIGIVDALEVDGKMTFEKYKSE